MDWDNEPGVLRQAAVNRVRDIGDLYDARNEKFTRKSLLASPLSGEMIEQDEINRSLVRTSFSNRLRDKFALLNISEELRIQILCDALVSSGSELYLTDDFASGPSASVFHQVVTTKQSLQGLTRELIDEAVLDTECTHVVVEIVSGNQCLLQLREKRKSERAEEDMKEDVEKIEKYVRSTGKTELHKLDDIYDFRLYVEGVPQRNLPKNLTDAVEFLSRFPTKVQDGSAAPIEYVMAPVAIFQNLLNVKFLFNVTLNHFDSDMTVLVENFFEELMKVKKEHAEIFRSNRRYALDPVEGNFAVQEHIFKLKLRELAMEFRAGLTNDKKTLKNFLEREGKSLITKLKDYQKKISRCEDRNNGGKVSPKEKSELNILILGKSGVGKSTWINSIINYLKYDSLDEAEQGEVMSVIPAYFTITYDIVKKKRIEVGEPDPNEVLDTGKSATKSPRTYTVELKDKRIRLIDTPGFGDTEGLEQDRENMKKILRHISDFSQLHAICILLKSNDTRLDVILDLCIRSVVTQLHKTAASNIVFCFTNSRSAFYGPGDTLPVLTEYVETRQLSDAIKLNQKTIYSLDNESFRFLCTLKYKDILGNDKDRETYKQSWQMSVEETNRLFDYIKTLDPHDMAKTTTMNKVANMIKPLADVTKVIQTNIANLSEEERNCDSEKSSDSDQPVPEIRLKYRPLEQPRTVCTNASCVRVTRSENGTTTTEYLKHCHPNCTCPVIDSLMFYPSGREVECSIMNDQTKNCRVCGCSSDKHMCMTYEIELVREEIASAMRYRRSTSTERPEQLKQLIQAYKEDQKTIVKTVAKFNAFLKENSIAQFSDGFKQCLNYLIDEEEYRVDTTGGGRELLQRLQDVKSRYEKESHKVSEENKEITQEEIQDLEKQLYGLKQTGDQIKKAVEVSSLSNQKVKASLEKAAVLDVHGEIPQSIGEVDENETHESKELIPKTSTATEPETNVEDPNESHETVQEALKTSDATRGEAEIEEPKETKSERKTSHKSKDTTDAEDPNGFSRRNSSKRGKQKRTAFFGPNSLIQNPRLDRTESDPGVRRAKEKYQKMMQAKYGVDEADETERLPRFKSPALDDRPGKVQSLKFKSKKSSCAVL